MRLVVARVGRAHGLRGEVSIEVRTDAPDQRFVKGAVLQVEDGSLSRSLAASGIATLLTVSRVRDNNGTLLLTFEEVSDRTTAEALRNAVLEVDLPEASDEPDAGTTTSWSAWPRSTRRAKSSARCARCSIPGRRTCW